MSAASLGTAELEKSIDPRYVSLIERERILDQSATGVSLRKIAAALGRRGPAGRSPATAPGTAKDAAGLKKLMESGGIRLSAGQPF